MNDSKSVSPLLPDRLDRQRVSLPSFDADEPSSVHQSSDLGTELIHAVGSGLEQVEELLQGLEDNPDLLGPAILRKCNELADGIGHLVNELEQHSEEQRLLLAEACSEDCSVMMVGDQTITQDQWMDALQGATVLLKDVQSAFRDVGDEDAQEIADVTLVAARMFLMSLQSFHASILPPESSSTVEILELSDSSSNPSKNPDMDEEENKERGFVLDEEERKERGFVLDVLKIQYKRKRKQNRVRVLWPPLGPHVAAACDWGKEATNKQPLLAVGLGLILWPAAIGTALLGGSIVLADGALQDAYNHFQDAPLLQTVEEGAAHLYHTSRLMLVTAKFGSRQTLRIVRKQVDRHGGVGQIAQNAADLAVYRALHPIETVRRAWDGLVWGIAMASDTIQVMMEQQRDQKVMEREL
jgi:hypothetical protein